MTYKVQVRPVVIGGRRYEVGETVKADEKEAVVAQLLQSGYLAKVKEKKDGKKTD